jgi:hypothetical protein
MPLTLISPVGGHVYNDQVSVPVAQWEGNWQTRRVEVTMTDDLGGTRYRGFVQDPEWSFTLYLNDTDAAVAAGFTIGTELATVKFKLGASSGYDIVSRTEVLGVRRVLNANGEPIGVTVTGAGGTVALNQ